MTCRGRINPYNGRSSSPSWVVGAGKGKGLKLVTPARSTLIILSMKVAGTIIAKTADWGEVISPLGISFLLGL